MKRIVLIYGLLLCLALSVACLLYTSDAADEL